MKKFGIFIVMILCVSLLAFAGCGEDNNGKIDQGTQSEQTTDNRGNSTMEDMSENVDDAVDDLEDKARDATPGGESRNTSRDSSAKSQND
ncbi:MAG: hypothetical protein GX663_07795 [Clostridiales bacterium]|nr:hypothetical protein [Clostridiales bacterium]